MAGALPEKPGHDIKRSPVLSGDYTIKDSGLGAVLLASFEPSTMARVEVCTEVYGRTGASCRGLGMSGPGVEGALAGQG